ncbi:MAG: hypothetical protein JNK58_07695 [Phycisphaerae bacterium]|nr:hypothetical protein [Phycisphaerae bacterium]
MTSPGPMQKRRHPRQHCRRLRVAWSLHMGSVLTPAAVTDISASGIGMIVERHHAPHMGGALRILSRRDQYVRHARVIRLAESANGKALVGCRWISSRGAGRLHEAHATRNGIALHHQDKGE